MPHAIHTGQVQVPEANIFIKAAIIPISMQGPAIKGNQLGAVW